MVQLLSQATRLPLPQLRQLCHRGVTPAQQRTRVPNGNSIGPPRTVTQNGVSMTVSQIYCRDAYCYIELSMKNATNYAIEVPPRQLRFYDPVGDDARAGDDRESESHWPGRVEPHTTVQGTIRTHYSVDLTQRPRDRWNSMEVSFIDVVVDHEPKFSPDVRDIIITGTLH